MFGRNSTDRSPESLAALWSAKFGTRPHAGLIEAVTQWKIDRRGNFRFRMKGGRKMFVGYRKGEGGKTGVIVETERGWLGFLEPITLAEAWHVALAHYSLGKRKISFNNASRKAKAQLWAAATMLDIRIENYTPDARALEFLQQLREVAGR